MRKTLHTVPLDIAPIVHQATLKIRLAECFSFYRRHNISKIDVTKLKEIIVELVKPEPLTTTDILYKIVDFTVKSKKGEEDDRFWKNLIRMTIKHLWEEGTLCYINASDDWESEKRLYGYTKNLYPELNFDDVETYQAQSELIHYYIRKYGPVTIKDMSWWSGLSNKVVQECILELDKQLLPVSLQGFSVDFYMTQDDFVNFDTFNIAPKNWHALLAYEDPSLKGYFESRSRYINPKYYNELFNTIGEARASIVVNGEVIGIWSWDKKARHIQWNLFSSLKNGLSKDIQQSIYELEAFLNNSRGFVQQSFL